MKKDMLFHEVLVKFANFFSTLHLFLNHIDLLVFNLINVNLITNYEKTSVYLLKQCFLYK